MAEFDRPGANDPAEAAYRDALLGDETGREQRRARLMAALPRPEASAVVPVSGHAVAWRASPYALGLVLIGLLLAGVLLLKGRGGDGPVAPDPRRATAPPASAAPVMAPANPVVEEALPAVAADAARVPTQAARTRTRPERAAPTVVADAAPRPPALQAEPSAAADVPVRATMAAPLPPPPAAAPLVAAAPRAAEPVAQAEAVSSSLAARAKVAPPAASRAGVDAAADLANTRAVTPADTMLLAAIQRRDLASVRSALQAGASAHVRDDQGRTVLMLAARTGAHDIVARLLAAGARKADRDPQGLTAVDHARDQAHEDLFDALR